MKSLRLWSANVAQASHASRSTIWATSFLGSVGPLPGDESGSTGGRRLDRPTASHRLPNEKGFLLQFLGLHLIPHPHRSRPAAGPGQARVLFAAVFGCDLSAFHGGLPPASSVHANAHAVAATET